MSHTSDISSSRVTTRSGSRANRTSRSNSLRVSSSSPLALQTTLSARRHQSSSSWRDGVSDQQGRSTDPATEQRRFQGNHLADGERLHHVIVGPELETDHAISHGPARRDDDDRHGQSHAATGGRRRARRYRGAPGRGGLHPDRARPSAKLPQSLSLQAPSESPLAAEPEKTARRSSARPRRGGPEGRRRRGWWVTAARTCAVAEIAIARVCGFQVRRRFTRGENAHITRLRTKPTAAGRVSHDAWEVYFRRPITEADVRREIRRMAGDS